jgi:N-acetylmuramoyl-L-alanine amidase
VRSRSALTVLFIALLAISGVALVRPGRTPAGTTAPLIAIDPGHGGPYSNANANGLREKTVNFQIAIDLRRVLLARGYRVVMVRTSDRDVELHDIPTWNWSDAGQAWSYGKDGHRGIFNSIPKDELQGKVDRANAADADLYISIHNNGAASRAARGTESFGAPRDPAGVRLASLVNAAVVRRTGLRNRGAQKADFYVLRWSNMPAVLVEGAFISSPADAYLLKRSSFRRRIAYGIADGIGRWFATDRPARIYPRIGGASAEAVAVASSRSLNPTSAPAVILASADDPRAAVCAPPLAAKLGAPLLFARRSALPEVTAAEIARLQPSRVIVLAPSSALDTTVVASAIASAAPGALAERIEATTSAQAAALVAERYFPDSARVALAATTSRVEQLAASTWAARYAGPLVITGDAQASLDHVSLATTPTALVIGSASRSILPSSSVVSVVSKGSEWWNNAYIDRTVYGRTRPVVATASQPTVAIVAAVQAARTKQPLILLDGARKLPTPSRWFITSRRSSLSGFTIVGIDSVTSPFVDRELAKAAWY